MGGKSIRNRFRDFKSRLRNILPMREVPRWQKNLEGVGFTYLRNILSRRAEKLEKRKRKISKNSRRRNRK